MFATLLLSACSAASGSDPVAPRDNALENDAGGPTLTFAADWTETATPALVAGVEDFVSYDPARLPTCRGTLPSGEDGWSIGASYSINGIPLGSFPVAGQGLTNTPAGPLFTPPFAGDLAMWFEITSAWGCTAFDSNYSQNYHFPVAAPPNAPGWVSGASQIIDRATCGTTVATRPCFADATSADSGFSFDTWARQEAAVHEIYFDVWKEGVTDFANPDLWQELDVQLYWRFGSENPFTVSYVNFSEYTGNNARYALDLATLDPFPTPNGNGLTSASECPNVPVTISADGMYVDTSVQYFFTVNGVPVTASAGGVLTGTYEGYAALYTICNY